MLSLIILTTSLVTTSISGLQINVRRGHHGIAAKNAFKNFIHFDHLAQKSNRNLALFATPFNDTTVSLSSTATSVVEPIEADAIEEQNVPVYTTTQNEIAVDSEEYKQGLAIVAFVTLLFATHSPVLHSAFSEVSSPPPVLLLNALTGVSALGSLLVCGPLLEKVVPPPATLEQDVLESSSENKFMEPAALRAGAELGLVKMLGIAMNLYGLAMTSADRGAFLIQLTTLIVPVVQGIQGVPISRQVWSAVGLALTGVFLFTQGSSGGVDGANNFLGDALCLGAAFFYATYDLLLFKWGKKVAPLELITNKIAVQSVLSIGLVAALDWNESYQYITNVLASGSHDALVVGFVAVWTGFIILSLANFLQVGGQQAIGPSKSQIIYASQPLWASFLAWAFLHETVGPVGILGGGLFVAAMVLAATAENEVEDAAQV